MLHLGGRWWVNSEEEQFAHSASSLSTRTGIQLVDAEQVKLKPATGRAAIVRRRQACGMVRHVFSHVIHDIAVSVTTVDSTPLPEVSLKTPEAKWLPLSSLASSGLTTWACKVLQKAVDHAPWLDAPTADTATALQFLRDRAGVTAGASSASRTVSTKRKAPKSKRKSAPKAKAPQQSNTLASMWKSKFGFKGSASATAVGAGAGVSTLRPKKKPRS